VTDSLLFEFVRSPERIHHAHVGMTKSVEPISLRNFDAELPKEWTERPLEKWILIHFSCDTIPSFPRNFILSSFEIFPQLHGRFSVQRSILPASYGLFRTKKLSSPLALLRYTRTFSGG